MEKKSLGSFIAFLRKEKGLTQKQLSELLNVSDKTVSHWECDETSPDISLLPLLSETLGVTVDELLKGEKKIVQQTTAHNYDPPKSESVFDKAGNFVSKTVNKIRDGMNGNINDRFRYFRILSLIGTVIGCVALFTVTLTNLLTGYYFHPTLAFTPGIIALIGSLWTIVLSFGFTLGARLLFSKDIIPSDNIEDEEKNYILKSNRISFNNLFLIFSIFPLSLTGIDIFPVFANLLIVSVLLLILRLILIVILSKKGVFRRNEKELLIIKYSGICFALITAGTAFGLFFLEAWHPTPDNIVFDNPTEFIAYMETAKDKPENAYLIDGVEATFYYTTMQPADSDNNSDSSDTESDYEEAEMTYIDCYGEDIGFRWLNKNVYDFAFNEDEGTFHVITYEAKIKAEGMLDLRDDLLSMILPLYYVPSVIICFVLYRRKKSLITEQ